MNRIEKALVLEQERGDRLRAEVDLLYKERDNCFQTHLVNTNRAMAAIERLTALEDKVFPDFGPMLKRIENVVGEFTTWHRDNPLDRRPKT